MTSFRQFRWWLLFGAGLLIAVTGWMWIMVRLVRSETESADARVRQAEEKLLSAKAKEVPLRLDSLLENKAPIPVLARSGSYSGWWQAPPSEELPLSEPQRKTTREWRERIRDKQTTATKLAKALKEQQLNWGWIEGGRDLVAGFLPSLYRNGDRSPELTELLSERVWDYDGPSVSPAFRLTLIRPLLELQPSDELQRLLEIETIRAAEGRTEELDQDYEVIKTTWSEVDTRTFWSKPQLLGLLDMPEDYQLFDSPPEDRAFVTVRGFRRWPYLAARSSLGGTASETGNRSLIWIGGASGLALVALALTAVFFGRHQLRLARLRTDLAASVAHELRTPLAGQRILLETLMESREQSPEQRDEYVAMAFRENKRLGRLAEEFLTFSRLERGVVQLDVEPVAIDEVIDGAVESLREKWEDPACELSIEVGENLPKMAADRQALITILRNLLENAWKYSKNPRKLEVRASSDGGDILISVSDNGIGLSAREQQRIFRQFYRVDQRLARSEEGLGLGLAIVKRLLESMDGSIEVTSEEGTGSEFRIRIPTNP